MLIAVWIIVLLVLSLWSLITWGIHSLLTLDPSRIDELKPLIEQIPYGEQIDLWLPGWQTLLQFVVDLTRGMFAGIANAAPWLIWALWAIGVVVILLCGGLATLFVVLVRNELKAPPQRPQLPAPPPG